jgi:hypothetical protein
MNNMLIVGDFNASSTMWGYSYQIHARKTVEEYLNSNSLTLLRGPGESNPLFIIQGTQKTLLW